MSCVLQGSRKHRTLAVSRFYLSRYAYLLKSLDRQKQPELWAQDCAGTPRALAPLLQMRVWPHVAYSTAQMQRVSRARRGATCTARKKTSSRMMKATVVQSTYIPALQKRRTPRDKTAPTLPRATQTYLHVREEGVRAHREHHHRDASEVEIGLELPVRHGEDDQAGAYGKRREELPPAHDLLAPDHRDHHGRDELAGTEDDLVGVGGRGAKTPSWARIRVAREKDTMLDKELGCGTYIVVDI